MWASLDNTYVYGLDLISVTDRTGAQTYFAYDGLGSTANLTDGAGNTTATYSYDVFGAIRSESGSGATTNEWRFTGEQRDSQVSRDYYYLRARYYDPATGRFLSHDPLPSGNSYAYSWNNPVNFSDPSGAWPRCLVWCDKIGDFGECMWNKLTCVDIDPFLDIVGTALCGKEGGFGCAADALSEIGGFLDNFWTLECLTAAITIAGLAAAPLTAGSSVAISSGAAVAISTAVNVGVNVAAEDGQGVVVEAAGGSPEAGERWLKSYLRLHHAYGAVVMPDGSQPMITTVKNLKVAGSGAFLLLSVAQCAESGLD